MKDVAERLKEISVRTQAIQNETAKLRAAREDALGDGDYAKADRLRAEIERNARQLDDLQVAASVVEKREAARLAAEVEKRRKAALAQLAELSRIRARVGRKVDLCWVAMEGHLQELKALEQKVRAASIEGAHGVDVSRRLGINARLLHRGAALVGSPTAAVLLGIERLPVSARRPLEAAFKVIGSSETDGAEETA